MEEITLLEKELDTVLERTKSRTRYYQGRTTCAISNEMRRIYEEKLTLCELKENKIRNLLNRLDVDNIKHISEEFNNIKALAE